MSKLADAVKDLSYRHPPHHIFSDFIEMAAISVSNAVDRQHFNEREKRYMEIVSRYKKNEPNKFAEMFALLVLELEEKPRDVLGGLFHELELHNTYKGQFFTPYPLCQMMSDITFSCLDAKSIIDERGFIRASEPAVGSGAMIIALTQTMRTHEINYQQCLHVTATDIDSRCVHMAYLQLSLLHVPAVVVHGNSLSLEEFGHWFTPAHLLGHWDSKLKTDSILAAGSEITHPTVATPKPIKESQQPKRANGGNSQLTLF